MNAAAGVALHMSEGQIGELVAAAEAAYPRECCALLIGIEQGQERRVTRLVPADNVDPKPERGFELDPAVLIRELRALREAERAGAGRGERLLGHAHSHPEAAAEPSARDRAQASEAEQIWLIVPVAGRKAGAPRAYLASRTTDGAAEFQPIPLLRTGRQETA